MTGRRAIAWLAPDSPPDAFPDVRLAWSQPNGLLAAGGDLSPQRLIAAYRRGIFPWFSAGEPILWWCPDPRTVLLAGEFHCSRRLRRTLRSNRFQLSVDQQFDAVISLCASTRANSGTWLTPEMVGAYQVLHTLGMAHSIEVWRDGNLAGGVYGIGLGGMFFGESMVSLEPDASKIALAGLVRIARDTGISLIDCQVSNDHLSRLGSRLMPRPEFLATVARTVDAAPTRRLHPAPPGPTAWLAE